MRNRRRRAIRRQTPAVQRRHDRAKLLRRGRRHRRDSPQRPKLRVHVPPPRSCAVTSSPVAAFTSGGPPENVSLPLTMMVSSDIAGRTRPCGARPIPRRPAQALGRQAGLIEEDAAEVLRSGTHRPARKKAPPESTERARQPVLERDLLRAEMLLDRDRFSAPLHRGVVRDDGDVAARHAADAVTMPAPGVVIVQT